MTYDCHCGYRCAGLFARARVIVHAVSRGHMPQAYRPPLPPKERIGSKIIRTVKAYEGEVVRIQWSLYDGGTHEQDVTVPPKDVRAARSRFIRITP